MKRVRPPLVADVARGLAASERTNP
jgi:hypothetical protein